VGINGDFGAVGSDTCNGDYYVVGERRKKKRGRERERNIIQRESAVQQLWR
jgi:hypothetical protein